MSLADQLRDLRTAGASEEDNSNVSAIFRCIANGVSRIVTANVLGGQSAYSATSSANVFGDVQLQGDLRAERCIVEELAKCEYVGVYSSEESPVDKPLNASGTYSVAFDPLDGSSIIGSNFSVGSIFGVFKGRGFVGLSGLEMVGAAYAVYGPRTVLVVAYDTEKGKVVKEFVLSGDTWVLDTMRTMRNDAKLMAPANLRASAGNEAYRSLIERWMAEGYTLRYTGGMVPDIHNLLVKGGGVFCNPISNQAPAKLRLLYECLPFAYIMEAAGGKAVSTDMVRVLERVVEKHDDRLPICLGSQAQVDMARAAFES